METKKKKKLNERKKERNRCKEIKKKERTLFFIKRLSEYNKVSKKKMPEFAFGRGKK